MVRIIGSFQVDVINNNNDTNPFKSDESMNEGNYDDDLRIMDSNDEIQPQTRNRRVTQMANQMANDLYCDPFHISPLPNSKINKSAAKLIGMVQQWIGKCIMSSVSNI